MKRQYRVLYEGGSGEYTEKKSRFIAHLYSVDTEAEALGYIEKIKKKYWDARHNCYAFVIGEHMEIQRFSDDGEPQGTAGKPILDVLLGENVHNTLIIVTRYFGGTLLGTGGLVRAYTKASREGLANSIIIEKKSGFVLEICTDYNGVGKIQYLLGQNGIDILNSEYGQDVRMELLVPDDMLDDVMAGITEVTAGKASIHKGKELFFARNQKEILVFDR